MKTSQANNTRPPTVMREQRTQPSSSLPSSALEATGADHHSSLYEGTRPLPSHRSPRLQTHASSNPDFGTQSVDTSITSPSIPQPNQARRSPRLTSSTRTQRSPGTQLAAQITVNSQVPASARTNGNRMIALSSHIHLVAPSPTASGTTNVPPSDERTDSPPQQPGVRRSGRVAVLTERGQAYFQSGKSNNMSPIFPHNGDEIVVRWVLKGQEVWWPASVVDIQEPSKSTPTCKGVLLYHQLENYDTEYMNVIFSHIESSCDSFVSADADNLPDGHGSVDTSLCTWLYKEKKPSNMRVLQDPVPNTVGTLPRERQLSRPDRTDLHDHQVKQRTTPLRHSSHRQLQQRSHPATRSPRRTRVPQLHSSIQKHSKGRKLASSTARCSPQPSGTTSEGTTSAGPKDNDITPAHSAPPLSTTTEAQKGETGAAADIQRGEAGATSDESIHFRLRLELLERKLQDLSHTPSSQLSSSAQSVIIALKWSLLLQLEKPLKELRLDGLSQLGIASHTYKISSHCDYSTFREIASTLASSHRCTDPSNSTGRLAFSPSFDIIQSSSAASDNLVAIFSTLADVMDFLQVRDQVDYESILSKEVFTEDKSIIRLVGTFAIEDGEESPAPSVQNGDTSSSESISVLSSQQQLGDKVIRIYVASSPVKKAVTDGNSTSHAQTNLNRLPFKSTVLEQKCIHFNNAIKSFQSKWRSSTLQSDFKVSCFFDLDGVARPSQLQNHFTLIWSRSQAPSTKKWTRDIHNIGNNSPGSVTLSVPTVFVSARKSVETLLSVIDRNIESFMEFRSEIQRRSSSS